LLTESKTQSHFNQVTTMNNQCIAIKASGVRCGKQVTQEGGTTRCIMHQKSITTNGPNAQQLKELGYVHKKEKKDLEFNLLARFHGRWENVTPDARAEYINSANRMVARQSVEKHDMIHRQLEANHRQGVNPDAEAIARRAQIRRQHAEALRERIRRFHEQQEFQQRQRAAGEELIDAVDRIQRDEDARIAGQARFAALFNENPVGHIQRALDARAQQGELAEFVNDRQNVHTTAAVKQTKEIVERIRKIPVPEGYRWHATESSKTPFEIGLECKLSQKAAWQMISQYAQDTAIYDIEPGIYGKVLDSVWQYIKNSPDKADMCVIIKSEMEDNIGMCAQGNLSRICNILAGILEGVGSQESLSERLGRLFGPLMEIEDLRDRIARGINILQENHVPSDEWSVWMEPLNEIEV
jgi:hypothetical protein